jgi:hypothetical protein
MALSFGMPAGFAEALAMKYGIMQQQANTQAVATRAAANLDNTRASLLPSQSEADIAEARARAGNINETTKTVMPLALSTIGLQGTQSRLNTSQAGSVDEDIRSKKQLNTKRPFGLGLGGSNDNGYGFGGYGFSFGG